MNDRKHTRSALGSALVALLLAPATLVAPAVSAAAADSASETTAGEAGAAEASAPDPFAVLEELPPPDYADIETYPGYVTRSDTRPPDEITLGHVDAPGPDPVSEDAGESALRRSGEVTMDVLVLRPFGALATATGCAFMAAAAPFLLASGDYDDALDTFVQERARFTFERPLGQF